MKLLKLLKARYKYQMDKKKQKTNFNLFVEKHKLNDTNEQITLVTEFNLIQEKKSKLSKSNRDIIESKILFMIEHKILEVKL